MPGFSNAYRGFAAAAIVAGASLLGGFTFRPGGPPELHYKEYNARPPRGNTVTVCHAHGCQKQETFTFTHEDITDLAVMMNYVRGPDTGAGERRAIAYAVGWMERRVGPATGTANDRASLGFMNASGQLDCVDEATNATSYLLVLQQNGLMRYHAVIRPFSKASFFKWPHFAAMIQERGTGKVYAVDSGVGPNGANPAITLASQWYIDDGYAAPERLPERTVAAVPPQMSARSAGGDDLGQLVERVLRESRAPNRPPAHSRFPSRNLR